MSSDPSANMQHTKSRLETAMERLERAIETRAERAGAQASVQSGLTSDLDAARAEIGRLKETNKVVSARLDAAIGRVKAILQD
jgi:hypothetical protein